MSAIPLADEGSPRHGTPTLPGIYADRGSYAEYLVTDADLAWKIPEVISSEGATTFGIGAVAAMQGLFLNLDVPWPDGTTDSDLKPGQTVSVIERF
jgi:NADPH:quinone reductase-like Zn-dependent oxidoreductase